jgi:hypothetical protein
MTQWDSVSAMKYFPESLQAMNPAEGHALARKVAESALAERNASPRDMTAYLSTQTAPSVEMLTAVYFQTIAAANGSWRR